MEIPNNLRILLSIAVNVNLPETKKKSLVTHIKNVQKNLLEKNVINISTPKKLNII